MKRNAMKFSTSKKIEHIFEHQVEKKREGVGEKL